MSIDRMIVSRTARCGLAGLAMILVAAAPQSADGTAAIQAIDPPALVRDAVAKTRAMAFYRDRVDWPALERDMLASVRTARDSVDMLAAYDLLIAALNDGHSFVNVSAEDRTLYRTRTGKAAAAVVAARRSAFVGRTAIDTRSVAAGPHGTANLVVVPAFSGGGARGNDYATRLNAAVVRGARSCGQVIDLRGNTGGNQWPMMAGLSSLFASGPQGLEVGPGGERRHYATLTRGRVQVSSGADAGVTLAEVTGTSIMPDLQRQSVAVLIDGLTASSGAGVAISLHGRPATRFFGERTHPTTSSNEGFVLADGTNIVVTTAMMADRRWTTFPGGLEPNETVVAAPAGDAPLERALAWLAATPQCRRAR